MRFTDRITVARLSRPADAVPQIDVVLNGRATGRHLDGAVLEAAVVTHEGYLLFLTDAVPFDASLGIHLLDDGLTPLDSARLAIPSGTGTFCDLHLVDNARLTFRFSGDMDWSLDLLDRPELRMPFFPEAAGLSRPFRFTRRFRITGEKNKRTNAVQ